eukprot:TRINITY_DN2507_c0_g3_i1.p1 TRINITY_DN2507_c0_g3~~TRINITY_DN2507_c0_g3_i1.p1  ORF type:complete len:1334 (+),score=342.31 TRINITY_DN2507_c0_g3_i1:63-4004(+)
MAACDPAQQECVEHEHTGALVIVAGPGSGKTHVLCSRIAWLIHKAKVPEDRILCVTFTTKAAREMHVRVSRMLQREHRCEIRTIHALGFRVASEHYEELGYSGPLRVMDGEPLKQLCREVGDGMNLPDGTRLDKIWDTVQQNGHDRAYADCEFYHELRRALQKVRDGLQRENACDFHDMVHLPLGLLQKNAVVRQKLAARYSHILVDEFQDTSLDQWHLLRSLVDVGHCGVTIVGDINQSIYAFRGADPRVFGAFMDAFPQATVKSLRRNYRCAQTISDVAASLIKNNVVYSAVGGGLDSFTKQLEARQVDVAEGSTSASAAESAPVASVRAHCAVVKCATVDEEAATLVAQIKFIGEHGGGTVGVLCRTHQPLGAMRAALKAAGVACASAASTPLHSSKAVQDVLAYLQLAANSQDLALLKRVVNRRPGKGVGGKKKQPPQVKVSEFCGCVTLALKDLQINREEPVSPAPGSGTPSPNPSLEGRSMSSVGSVGVYAALQSLVANGVPAPQNPHARDDLTVKKLTLPGDGNGAAVAAAGPTKKKSPARQSTLFSFKGFKDASKAQSSPVVRRGGTAKGKPLEEGMLLCAKGLLHLLGGARKAAKAGGVAAAVRFIVKECGLAPEKKKEADAPARDSGSDDVGTSGGASAKAVARLQAAAAACCAVGADWAARIQTFCEDVVVAAGEVPGAAGGAAKVALTTIHAAKGLEYDYCFLVRCNEGVLPCGAKLAQLPKVGAIQRMRGADVTEEFEKLCSDLKEERRLCYVAMTRAARWVCLSYVANEESTVSRFVDEVIKAVPSVQQYTPATAPAGAPLPVAQAPLPQCAVERSSSSATLAMGAAGAPEEDAEGGMPFAATPSEEGTPGRPWDDEDVENMTGGGHSAPHAAGKAKRVLFGAAPAANAKPVGFTSARAVLAEAEGAAGKGAPAPAPAPASAPAPPPAVAAEVSLWKALVNDEREWRTGGAVCEEGVMPPVAPSQAATPTRQLVLAASPSPAPQRETRRAVTPGRRARRESLTERPRWGARVPSPTEQARRQASRRPCSASTSQALPSAGERSSSRAAQAASPSSGGPADAAACRLYAREAQRQERCTARRQAAEVLEDAACPFRPAINARSASLTRRLPKAAATPSPDPASPHIFRRAGSSTRPATPPPRPTPPRGVPHDPAGPQAVWACTPASFRGVPLGASPDVWSGGDARGACEAQPLSPPPCVVDEDGAPAGARAGGAGAVWEDVPSPPPADTHTLPAAAAAPRSRPVEGVSDGEPRHPPSWAAALRPLPANTAPPPRRLKGRDALASSWWTAAIAAQRAEHYT